MPSHSAAEQKLPAHMISPLHPCSPILLFQFVYKTIFFFRSTLPALRRNRPADRPAIKMGEPAGPARGIRLQLTKGLSSKCGNGRN